MGIELFVVGLISVLGQIVVMRELIVAFYGVELVYVLAMGLWLAWSALGATIGRRAYAPPVTVLRLLFLASALLLPAMVAFVRGLRILFNAVPGAYLPFGHQMAAMALSLFPTALLSGLIFQWAAKGGVSRGRSLAVAYAIEGAGGLAGGVAATMLLKAGMQNLTIALVCALAAAAAAAIPTGTGKRPAVCAGLAGVLLLCLLAGGAEVDRRMTAWSHPNVAATADSAYGRITISERLGQFAVFENGALAFDTEGVSAETLVHLAALQHPDPDRVLVLGGGIAGHLGEIRKHRPEKIDTVVLDPVLLELAEAVLPEPVRGPLRAEGTEVVVDDPRRFLTRAGAYDLILAVLPEPLSGQTNRFYTAEFFNACAQRLAPGGLLAFSLPAAENLWPRPLIFRNASVLAALRAAFSDALVLPAEEALFLAADHLLERRPEPLVQRHRQRQIDARLVSPAYIDYRMTNDRIGEAARLLAAADAPPNTDRRPVCYPYSLIVWLSQFFPERINRAAAGIDAAGIWPILPAAGALFFILRRTGRPRRLLIAFCAGLLGMVLETVLILQYQVKSGVLFQDIGLLLTAFMAGLALGAPSLEAAGGAKGRPALGRAAAGGFAVAGLLAAGGIAFGLLNGLFGAGLLLFFTGAAVSALFAVAALDAAADARAAAPSLIGADLLGGCIGTVAASLILIPFFGMVQTAAMAALMAAALVLLI